MARSHCSMPFVSLTIVCVCVCHYLSNRGFLLLQFLDGFCHFFNTKIEMFWVFAFYFFRVSCSDDIIKLDSIYQCYMIGRQVCRPERLIEQPNFTYWFSSLNFFIFKISNFCFVDFSLFA